MTSQTGDFLIEFDLNQELDGLIFPECMIQQESGGQVAVDADFYIFELVMDNFGYSAETSLAFIYYYTNTNDSVLGDYAPQDMYIASYLNQKSIVYGPGYPNVIQTLYDAYDHEGLWDFKARACIDRRPLWGVIDCDPGSHFV